MSDIASFRNSRLVRVLWVVAAVICAIAMYLMPGHETIPFHLIWIGLCLVYGLTVWRPVEMAVMIALTAAATGAIMVNHASKGLIEWPETAEVPLSVALTALIAWYLRRRQLALAELARIAEEQRQRAETRQLLVRQVSHELRTPITIARGYSELVRRQLSDPSAADDMDVVLDELDKLGQITQRLVTLIQIDGRLDREPIGLRAELERIVHRWIPAADREWTVRCPEGDVPANRDRLEAALDCLLDNGIRYTERGDRITVEGEVDARSWSVRVTDTGAGMSTEGAASSGTGLGLGTVRSVVDAWGGSLRIDSAPGKGTVVTLDFPNDSPVMNLAGAQSRP